MADVSGRSPSEIVRVGSTFEHKKTGVSPRPRPVFPHTQKSKGQFGGWIVPVWPTKERLVLDHYHPFRRLNRCRVGNSERIDRGKDRFRVLTLSAKLCLRYARLVGDWAVFVGGVPRC